MNRRTEVIPLASAFGAAVVGVLVYLLDRPSGSVYFIPDWLYLTDGLYLVFGQIGYHLPTFTHVYVFILLTFIVVSPQTAVVYPICITWFTVDSLFELAQITPIAQWVALHVPAWFTGIPFLENTAAFFIVGTFDFFDLISIAMGTVAAYLTIRGSCRGGESYV